MVAIITSPNYGLERSSARLLGSGGQIGQSSLGRANGDAFVNAATGQLLLSRTDEFLIGKGPDQAIDIDYGGGRGGLVFGNRARPDHSARHA